ncbi:uncharacterized protein LOC143299865 [Babylonia areolata]|uniref:uncharacterized protein LOC143299865 n=1 Tax=Babylonia areolata TaxID=304850 RepID=UPI003FCFE308
MAEVTALAEGVRHFGNLEMVDRIRYHEMLQQEAMNGNCEAVEQMLALGLEWKPQLTPVKHNPVHAALQNEDVELAKLLLGIENLAHEPNCYGETPLHLACRKNMAEVSRQLLELGVDMNARDQEEGTPLFHAVYQHSTDCVQLLIEAGCDLDALTDQLMTPMDQALLNRHQDIVALLLCAGCTTEKLQGHVFYRDHTANSFFCSLWESGDLDNMRLFLDCGYRISPPEMCALKKTCRQLSVHQMERDTLEILKDVTERPQKLSTLCRVSVRRMLMKRRCQYHTPMNAMIGSLPVPAMVKQFLMMTTDNTLKETQSQ